MRAAISILWASRSTRCSPVRFPSRRRIRWSGSTATSPGSRRRPASAWWGFRNPWKRSCSSFSQELEDRYQSASGVHADLSHCLKMLDAQGRIGCFALGGHDRSDRLVVPERLYGREFDVQSLLSAFDRVVRHGGTELILLSGYSGIGKSSVVNELQKMLVAQRSLFASGKFDQYKRDIPYATLAQAMRSLVEQILGFSDDALGRWGTALREAVGQNGQLVVDLVPQIELVIGKQPPGPGTITT